MLSMISPDSFRPGLRGSSAFTGTSTSKLLSVCNLIRVIRDGRDENFWWMSLSAVVVDAKVNVLTAEAFRRRSNAAVSLSPSFACFAILALVCLILAILSVLLYKIYACRCYLEQGSCPQLFKISSCILHRLLRCHTKSPLPFDGLQFPPGFSF